MALPERKPDWQHADSYLETLPQSEPGLADPLVEVGFEEFFGEEAPNVDEQWCVDHGDSIVVMTTAHIRVAVANGALSTDKKTWRDGHACWLPIHEFPELSDGEPLPLLRAIVENVHDGPAWGSDAELDLPESGVRRIQHGEPRGSVFEASSVHIASVSLVSIKAAALSFAAVVGAAACVAIGAYFGTTTQATSLQIMAPDVIGPATESAAELAAVGWAHAPEALPSVDRRIR